MSVDVSVLESVGALESLGDLLRHWRKLRGLSQLALALEAGSSARHLSFVESGRAQPSRAMVLRLAEALRLSLRDQNLLLGAAGFAPAYPESPLDSAALERARMALELMLAKQEPYPALVMNRSWEVIMTNRATGRLFGLLELDPQALDQGFNGLRSFFHPEGLKRFIRNWPVAAGMTLARMQRDLALTLDPGLFALMEEVKTYPGVSALLAGGGGLPAGDPVVPLEIEHDGRVWSWFTTIATFGTPQDVTLQELKVEMFFPMDPETEEGAKRLLG